MATVTFRHVDKIYEGNVHAVIDFNLHIKDQEFCVFVGPSGCGKSTTMRMVAGLEEITRGTVLIDDKVINDLEPKDRECAMVFQNYALYPHMSVYENMAFGLRVSKTDPAIVDTRIKEAAQLLELHDLLERKPGALSGGQAQRVAMGRAIVKHPKVFLFDEPLSNLDAKLRVQMRGEIAQLHKTLKSTMIYVTHDQIEAMTMGDRIVVMKDGIVQQVDNPLNIYNSPVNKFVGGFIGSPPMNFFTADLIRDGAACSVKSENGITLALPAETVEKLSAKNYNKSRIIVGMRPEDLKREHESKAIKNPQTINGMIEIIENLGSFSIIHVSTEDYSFAIKIDEVIDHGDIGKNIKITVDMDKVILFDIETEAALTI